MVSHSVRILAVGLGLLVSGCFEFKEIVQFNKDGSGTFSMVVGIQDQFRALVAMTRKMQEDREQKKAEEEKTPEGETRELPGLENGDQSPGTAAEQKPELSDFEQSKRKIETMPGITNVRSEEDKANMRFGIHFDFADVKALNRALHQLQKDPGPEVEYIVYTPGNFERLPIVAFKQAMQKSLNKDGQAKSEFDPAILGIKFLYITEYTFPVEVRSVSNPRAQIQGDRRTVRLEHSMFDPREQDVNVGNKIQLKRWYHTCLPFL